MKNALIIINASKKINLPCLRKLRKLPGPNKVAFNKKLYGTNFPTLLIHFLSMQETAAIDSEKPPITLSDGFSLSHI